VQACAGAALYWSGFGVQHLGFLSGSEMLRTAIGLPLTIFWVLLITNAFNLIDGLDGLAAGSAFFSTMVMFVDLVAEGERDCIDNDDCACGGDPGFLRYNSNPASIFLGDSGACLWGSC